MPSSHVPSMNDRWRLRNVRSRTDFQLRFKKNKLFRINLNKWTLILGISKLIVKERVTSTSLYIQLVRLLAYF